MMTQSKLKIIALLNRTVLAFEKGFVHVHRCAHVLTYHLYPIGILGLAWCLIVSIPDLCPLSYFADNGRLTFELKLLR